MEVLIHGTNFSSSVFILRKPVSSVFIMPISMQWCKSIPEQRSNSGLRLGRTPAMRSLKSSMAELGMDTSTSKDEGPNSGGGRDEELVEELERWEEETLMGKDEGREPMDYERRARLFAECARVHRARLAEDKARTV